MNSIVRRWYCENQRNSRQLSIGINNELKNLFSLMEKLSGENVLFQHRFDKLEERYQRWIEDEQKYLLNRMEQLEKENCQLRDLYQIYQNESETCLRTITDLIIKILLTQQELGKQYIEQQNGISSRRTTQERNQSINGNRRSRSYHMSLNPLDDDDDDEYLAHNQRLIIAKEHDQKPVNHSSDQNQAMATVKSKSTKPLTSSTNKLYFVLNDEKTAGATRYSSSINTTTLNESNSSSRKQSSLNSPMTFNKTRTTYSNHERLPNMNKTTHSKPSHIPITTNNRQRLSTNNNNNNLLTNKSSRTRPILTKTPSPIRPVNTNTISKIHSRTGQTDSNKTRMATISQQTTARVTDLDAVMAERQKAPRSIISSLPQTLFSKNTVKVIRPVRSQELKLFSCHLIPEIIPSFQTNDSLSTLTPPSLESLTDNPKPSSNISDGKRDFSEDSLNEHHHIQNYSKQTSSIPNSDNLSTNSKEEYYLVTKENPLSTHRLIFPARLGRMVFYRRILSDSDIYQKICSKDNEISHHVYHLDTIRDYSMEYYMLTTYASDSQLRAWIDCDDDELVNSVCHLDENRFVQDENDINSQEELDWYSEIDGSSSASDQQQMNEQTTSNTLLLSPSELFSISSLTSTDLTSTSWNILNVACDPLESTPPPPALYSTNTSHESDGFQSDFYYLCPISNTRSFSKTEV